MKILRLLVYEGEPDVLAKHFTRALPSGKHTYPGITITVLTLGAGNPAVVDNLKEQFKIKEPKNEHRK